MSKILKIVLIILSMTVLVSIRYFEDSLFYDPLNAFFKADYLNNDILPDLDKLKLIGSVSLRYWINSGLSLLILWIAFQKKDVFWLSLLIFSGFYFLLAVVFYLLIRDYASENYLSLFYVRRFLIQPLLLLILLPAFYYQRSLEK